MRSHFISREKISTAVLQRAATVDRIPCGIWAGTRSVKSRVSWGLIRNALCVQSRRSNTGWSWWKTEDMIRGTVWAPGGKVPWRDTFLNTQLKSHPSPITLCFTKCQKAQLSKKAFRSQIPRSDFGKTTLFILEVLKSQSDFPTKWDKSGLFLQNCFVWGKGLPLSSFWPI